MIAKILDFVLSKAIIFGITMGLLSIVLDDIWLNITLTCLITILISMIYRIFLRHAGGRAYYRRFETFIAVKGNDFLLNLLTELLKDHNPTVKKEGIVLDCEGKKSIIIPSVKFGTTGIDELMRVYREHEKSYDKIYFISAKADRNALVIAGNYARKITYIPLQAVYKMLKKQKLLPDMSREKLCRGKLSTQLFDIIFARRNAVRFFFVAVILFVMAVILPITAYYIIIGSANLTFALICLLRSHSNSHTKTTIFDR